MRVAEYYAENYYEQKAQDADLLLTYIKMFMDRYQRTKDETYLVRMKEVMEDFENGK